MSPVLLLVTLACAEPRLDAARPTSATAVFPHDDDFAAGEHHGAAWLEAAPGRCTDCHPTRAASAEGPPACASCHDAYPHPSGWRAGAEHGAGLSGEDADRSACLACHEVPGSTATDQAGCSHCHASYPHPTGWAEAGVHGVVAAAGPDPAIVCGSCHGGELQGTATTPACAECHPAYPHAETWSEPTEHGAAALTDLEGCVACHVSDDGGPGGAVGVACSRCHAPYPHPEDWLRAHLDSALLVGEAVCLRCHLAGDGPDTVVATCATRCHGGEG